MSEVVVFDKKDPLTWCKHKPFKELKPPRSNCKGCWFKYFHAKPGVVLALISIMNKVSEMYVNGEPDENSITEVARIIRSGMGNKFHKQFNRYLEEIHFKEKEENDIL